MASVTERNFIADGAAYGGWASETGWLADRPPLIVPLDEDGWHAVFPQASEAIGLPALVIVRLATTVFELLVCEEDDPAAIGRYASLDAAGEAARRWLLQQQATIRQRSDLVS